MTDNKTVQRPLAAIASAMAALSLATLVVADPAAEDDAILTEGSAAHTLPDGQERQANEPTMGDRPQRESPLSGVAPLEDEIDPARPFSDLDLDRDGVLTPNEAHASPRIGTDWRRLDTNNDGVIDRSEWSLVVDQPPPSAEEAHRSTGARQALALTEPHHP